MKKGAAPQKKHRASTEPVFREQEKKLNADSADALDNVFQKVMEQSDHFVTQSDGRFVPSGGENLGWDFETPVKTSNPRDRLYFDTPRLKSAENGIEFRIEKKNTVKSAYPYKQIIKVAQGSGLVGTTLDRMEYPAWLHDGLPDFSVVKNTVLRRKLSQILKRQNLRPLIRIISQRRKFLYHPDGDTGTTIEIAFDKGRGQTVSGFTWDIFQVELELIAGDPKVLDREAKRLLAFKQLSEEITSKPQPGWDNLAQYLPRSVKARKVVMDMSPSKFAVIPGFDKF